MPRRALPILLALVLLPAAAGAAAATQATTPVASPAAGADVEPLLAVTLPAAALPARVQASFGVGTWPAGAAQRTPAGATPAGAGVDLVLAGRLGVRSAGPLLVARAGGAPAPAAAGTEVELGPGDAAAFLDAAAAWETRTAGTGPATLLYLSVGSLDGPTTTGTPEVTGEPAPEAHCDCEGAIGYLGETQWASLGGGDVAATFARATIAPGASLPAHAGPGLRLVGSETVAVGEAGVLPGPLANTGDSPLVVYVLTLAPAGGAATPVASPSP
jgi:hypothetical protein